MSERQPFTATVPEGALGGWVEGAGVPVLLLHGGPGMGFEYLDGIDTELGAGFRVANFQQRGLEPSTLEGPFTVTQAISDVMAVLDALQWSRALLVGHSWGGHLAMRVAAAHPERLLGVLAVDPLGIVGDGGMAGFEAEMLARAAPQVRERIQELDERELAGEGSPDDALESLRLIWPSYFADPEHAPPMPPVRLSTDAHVGIMAEVASGTEEVAAALALGQVSYGVIAGSGSPMPWGQAAKASAELSPRAYLTIVQGAGHFPWIEVPGCVRTALNRLAE